MPTPATAPPVERFQWRSALLEQHPETPTVSTFRMAPPGRPFRFRPGQYLQVRLPGIDDPRGDVRTFSISSGPQDLEEVSVTTRRGPSPFKTRFFALAPGDEVDLWGPFGTFLRDPARPAVLLGGGIGVTPFRSMVREVVGGSREATVLLLYSSPTAEELVFRAEFEELARRSKGFRPVLLVSRPGESKSPWSGRTGRVDAALIREETRGLERPVYYICGPPAMVEGLRAHLEAELHVPAADIRSERFSGY